MRRPAFFLVVWLLLTALPPAWGYIDPGQGMLAIQSLIAIVGGLIAFIRNPMPSIKKILKKLRRNGDE